MNLKTIDFFVKYCKLQHKLAFEEKYDILQSATSCKLQCDKFDVNIILLQITVSYFYNDSNLHSVLNLIPSIFLVKNLRIFCSLRV